MWSKMESDLGDTTRIFKLKCHTPLSGLSNFSSHSVGEFSSNGNISIILMLDFNVMLDRSTRSR
jgi:hypothetical protein